MHTQELFQQFFRLLDPDMHPPKTLSTWRLGNVLA